jgi:hypothetical protein
LYLSTGEKSLIELLPTAREGQLVRLADIPAEVQSNSAFETIPASGIKDAGEQYYQATKDYHGTVGYDWLRHLVALGPKRIQTELKQLRWTWRALREVAEIIGRAHPQVVSVVNRFALVAAALHMAAVAGLIPWRTADIDSGIIRCMTRWLRQRGNTDAVGELLREIERRRQMIAETIDDRFIDLADGRPLDPLDPDQQQQFDGYIKQTQGGRRILIRPEAWQRLCNGLDADTVTTVKKHLLKAGLLIPGRNGDVPSVEKIGGKSQRLYVLAEPFIEIN